MVIDVTPAGTVKVPLAVKVWVCVCDQPIVVTSVTNNAVNAVVNQLRELNGFMVGRFWFEGLYRVCRGEGGAERWLETR